MFDYNNNNNNNNNNDNNDNKANYKILFTINFTLKKLFRPSTIYIIPFD